MTHNGSTVTFSTTPSIAPTAATTTTSSSKTTSNKSDRWLPAGQSMTCNQPSTAYLRNNTTHISKPGRTMTPLSIFKTSPPRPLAKSAQNSSLTTTANTSYPSAKPADKSTSMSPPWYRTSPSPWVRSPPKPDL